MSMIENFLKKRGTVPVASKTMATNVSQYRREILEKEVARGDFKEKGNTGYNSPYSTGKTSAGVVLGSRIKTASSFSSNDGGSSGGYRGSGGTVRQVPEIYSPLWLTSNLNLPRDRSTINAWSRHFFAFNPMVQNAITLHSTYPISKLNITCKNGKIEQFFNEMIEEIDLMNVCVQIAQEYWVLGEAFPYSELDQGSNKWSRIILQNPDYVMVKHSVIAGEPILSLRPDENLKRIVTSNRPGDIQQRQRLDGSIIEHVKRGENIPLSNFYASHIARKLNPYESRGTGLIVSCFKNLMLYDKIRECKFAQADNMINPLTLIKIGNGPDGFKPSPEDLEAYRDIFEQAQYDKDFKIFTHDSVVVEKIGSQGQIIDTTGDIEKLTKEIYMGLMVPQVLMDGGGDVTYSNAGVTLDVLKQRYIQFREKLANWLRVKIFAPISKINDFYEYKDGKKILVVPEIEWNHMSLFDAGDYINTLIEMRTREVENPGVSRQTIYKSMGLDFEDESRKLREEAIKDAIQEKEKAALQTYSLSELRTLGSDDPIEEKEQAPLPGEQVPGEEGLDEGMGGIGGGMGGIDFGGPPGGLEGGDESAPMPEGEIAPPLEGS